MSQFEVVIATFRDSLRSLGIRLRSAARAFKTAPPIVQERAEPIKLLKQETSLERYLQYYVGLDAPGYAILVTGPWGAGKTYQVRACLPPDRAYFVSLYGIDSVARLHSEVLAAAAPTLSKLLDPILAGTRAAADYVKVGRLADVAPQAMSIWLRQMVDTNNVLVFDDLERCSIPLEDLLGAINT